MITSMPQQTPEFVEPTPISKKNEPPNEKEYLSIKSDAYKENKSRSVTVEYVEKQDSK